MQIQRGRCKNPDALATPEDVAAMRGSRGKLNWARGEGLPRGSGDASLLSSALPNCGLRSNRGRRRFWRTQGRERRDRDLARPLFLGYV